MSVIAQITVGSQSYEIQSIEYIVGTQSSSTNQWTGTSRSKGLDAGKVIAYKLPYANTNSAATLLLTFSTGTTSGYKSIKINGTEDVTNQFPVNSVILMIYDGTYWQVLGGGSSDLATTSEDFIQTVEPTTSNLTADIAVSGVALVVGTTSVITGVTYTTSSAVTAVNLV